MALRHEEQADADCHYDRSREKKCNAASQHPVHGEEEREGAPPEGRREKRERQPETGRGHQADSLPRADRAQPRTEGAGFWAAPDDCHGVARARSDGEGEHGPALANEFVPRKVPERTHGKQHCKA